MVGSGKRQTGKPRQTVFVVGAGASMEFGLPSGEQLRKSIREKLAQAAWNGAPKSVTEHAILSLHRTRGADVTQLVRGAQALSRSLQSRMTIDDASRHFQDNEDALLMLKWALADEITKRERDDTHLASIDGYDDMDISCCDTTWLATILGTLLTDPDPATIKKRLDQVAFVTFNYDRIIQRLVGLTLQRLHVQNWKELLSGLRIAHAYGSIGSLAWPDRPEQGVEFGGPASQSRDQTMQHQIATWWDKPDEQDRENIHSWIREADQVAFMGFGFHERNVQLLTPPDLEDRREIYATAYGLPEPTQRQAEKRLRALSPTRTIQWRRAKCVELAEELQHALGF